MNDRNDAQWESLQAAWTEDGEPVRRPDLAALRRRARRDRTRLWILAALEVVLAAGVAALVTRAALVAPRPPIVVAAAATYLFFLVAFVFTYRNRRGLWRVTAESTRGFVELARTRCLRRLRTVSFVWGLLAAESLFLAAWIPWQVTASPALEAGGAEPYLRAYGLLVGIVVIYALFLVWYGRRTRAELADIESWLAD